MGKLEGSVTKGDTAGTGWSSKLLSSGSDSRTVLESVNFCIPLARGIATIPTAWLVSRLGHRKSSVMALLLSCAALPLVFTPNFSGFIVGRMVMAVGGTMLIIFIQPVVAHFFTLKQKGYLSIVTTWAYIFGALMVNLVFLSKDVSSFLVNHWQVTAAVSGGLLLVPFVLYLCFGQEVPRDKTRQEATLSEYVESLKNKDCWLWIFFYSFLLVVSVLVSQFVPRIIQKSNPSLLNSMTTVDWTSLYTILFYLGAFSGFVVGLWNRSRARRKPLIIFCSTLTSLLWGVILTFSLVTSVSTTISSIVIFTSIYWLSFFGMGVQSVLLYIPHEYQNKGRNLTIFYSYLWGLGYVLFSIYYFAVSKIFDLDDKASIYVITGLILMFMVFSWLIKESRPNWPLFPWSKKDRFGNKLFAPRFQVALGGFRPITSFSVHNLSAK